MNSRLIGKGADQKVYCALFLSNENEDDGQKPEPSVIEKEHIRALSEAMRFYDPGIVLIGEPAAAGARAAALEKEKEFEGMFPAWVYRQLSDKGDDLQRLLSLPRDSLETLRIAPKLPALLFPLGKSGIFGGLWETGEALRCGMEIELSSIPVRQSVIEICNVARLDPYSMQEEGTALLVCKNPLAAVSLLKQEHINAAAVGYINKGGRRIIKNGDDIRYLDNPRD